MSEVVKEVDAIGLTCPMPLLKAKQALNSVNSGDQIKVLSTDQGSWRDFHVFAEQSGHKLINSAADNNIYTYWLEKK
jgi:tRNA 2-thiouridine synthesizing protein A